ncbi:ABC transporter permease subunit [Rossellomorea aquimaris]|uniref:ABC transporter permease subunit n=1 Tax=Rossellomorea aquimaris TaxID=189382 RepID=UPI001CD37511|nr:ABC transporter permease subunit [Rossellomorea aquimaris]MCA1060571.1 ABC transporter permease subunit [Rossellomorea aquimaris]
MKILKSMRFWLPLGFLLMLLSSSFIVPYLFPNLLEPGPPYLKDGSGRVIADPPYSLEEMMPLGSDKLGRNLFYILLAGAKYTLLSAIVIALLRMVGGFLFGILYAFLPNWVRQMIKGVGDTFNFIPLAIIAFVLLTPLQLAFEAGAMYSFQFLIIEVVVIALIVIPSLGMYLGEEMKEYLKNDFISVSRQIGATRFHIIKQHLRPQFSRHALVMFSEQVSQTLYLLIQLGVLHICLGGLKTEEFGIMEHIPEYFSYTNEWAATMSINIQMVFLHTWLVLTPLAFFAISIFCINEITRFLKEVLLEETIPAREGRTSSNKPASRSRLEDPFSFTDGSKEGFH